MKHCATLLFLSAISLSTMGCFSLTDKKDTPHAPTVTQAQQNLENKKKNLQSRKPSFTLPENLGGIISSDRWVVYQEKQQEEFTGHVNYDNGQYIFKADYVLSQRKKNLLTAKGNVFARCNAEEGIWYELHADQANYNYQAGNGNAKANRNKLAQLIYHTVKDELLTAYAQQAQFNTKEQTFQLDGKATLIYTNKQGQTLTLKADHITARQKDQYALLKGHAEVDNGQYQLKAQTLEYDGIAQQARAYGERPLTSGTTEEGTFAIIADEVSANTESHHVQLEGHVQGWVIADKINQSPASKAF